MASNTPPDTAAALPVPVVAIGASAGGLRALERFLSQAAPAGLAFVIVQHLSPDHASILPQILSANSRLPVEAVNDGTAPEADRVYVIPPNTSLVVREGRLRLQPPEPRAVRHPIDMFLASLAHELGGRAAGVVLSGTGSDGAAGIRAIKRAGGFTLVQTPAEAEYDAMPRAALATGDVDYVVPAAEMPGLIAREIQRRLTEGPPPPPAPSEDDALEAIAQAVQRSVGHELTAYKRSTLRRRIQRRMDQLQVADFDDYLRRIEEDAREAEALVSEMLIGVTQYFRDPESFEALSRAVVPSLLERAAREPVRVWVPGCATGEEAYSIAMMLREAARRQGQTIPALQVFATDIDEGALGTARRGRYPPAVAKDVPEALLAAYFTRVDDGYEVIKEVKDGVIFSVHDVLSDPPFSRLDLVSCRNLLIYFHPAVQQRLIPLFHYALRPRGFLFLGSAEMVDERSDLLEPVDRKHRIYLRRELERPPALPIPIGAALEARRPQRPRVSSPSSEPPLLQAALLSVLETQRAALALVDRHGEARYFGGAISRYLPTPTGTPTSSLVALAPVELRSELATALDLANTRGSETCRPVLLPGAPSRRAELVVRPVTSQRELTLVLFRELPAPGGEPVEAAAGSEPAPPAQDRSPQERASASEQLRSANEELQTMNEELQSANEELHSANEELQVSQEELQSVNEELHTVNAELSRKVEELNDLNSDLRNLFQSTRIATVFLDGDLRIARFTPAAAQLFPVSERDVGRPLADLISPFDGDLVLELVRGALERRRVEERVATVTGGSAHYLLRALPYQRQDGSHDGAVLTLVDVSELKRIEHALRESEERFRLLIDGVKDVAIFMLSPDGRIATWNPGAERLTGWRAEESLHHHLQMFYLPDDVAAGKPKWMLERAAAEGSFHDEGWRVRKDGTHFWASVIITALRDEAGRLRGFSKIARDMTERMQMEEQLRRADRRKSEFLSVLSHELRNPLAPIRNSVYILRRGDVEGEQLTRNLAVVDRQVQQLTRLTDDLLDVTRISSGKIRLQLEQVDFTAVVRRTVDDHRHLLESAGIAVEVTAAGEPVYVNADASRLSQIVSNLLQNAGKFTLRGGRVTLAVEPRPDGFATLTVRDTGEGISPELLPQLFEPFVQSERALNRNPGGLGLGLALVKGLTELHGGKVGVQSDGAGTGATFVVQLPLDRRKRQRVTVVDAPEPVSPRRILLIEDNVDAATTLREALTLDGHLVELAFSGPDGIEKIHSFSPEVVLCDIGLPGMTGYEIAQRVRSHPQLRSVHLVALSGYAQPEDVEMAHKAGFDVHLAKPPDLDRLRRAIAELRPRELA